VDWPSSSRRWSSAIISSRAKITPLGLPFRISPKASALVLIEM
jgi:hypothetical protein